MDSLNEITITFKEKDKTFPTSLGLPVYSFKCLGAITPSTVPSSSSKIKVEYLVSDNKIVSGEGSDPSSYYSSLITVTEDLAKVTYTKEFCYIPG